MRAYTQMSAGKIAVQRAFNTHFFEFLDDVITILPDNVDLIASRKSFELYKKANPTLLVKLWYSYIYAPYASVIDDGNLDFFIEKDYSGDVLDLANSRDILNTIDTLRKPIKEMGDVNRAHALEYVQNLCKLSNLYHMS
jgi:hypothetical protein